MDGWVGGLWVGVGGYDTNPAGVAAVVPLLRVDSKALQSTYPGIIHQVPGNTLVQQYRALGRIDISSIERDEDHTQDNSGWR